MIALMNKIAYNRTSKVTKTPILIGVRREHCRGTLDLHERCCKIQDLNE